MVIMLISPFLPFSPSPSFFLSLIFLISLLSLLFRLSLSSRACAHVHVFFAKKFLHILHISANFYIYNVLRCEGNVKDVKEMAEM